MPVDQHITFDDGRWRTSLEGSDVRLGELQHGVVGHVFGPFGGAVVRVRGVVRSH